VGVKLALVLGGCNVGAGRKSWGTNAERGIVAGGARRDGGVRLGRKGNGTCLLRLGPGQEGDPSSQRALLWMTAKGGLGEGTGRLGEADRFERNWRRWRGLALGVKTPGEGGE
jgi:hypothetical protein